ncbi:MAG: hypothetical protein OWS74_09460, partial [Firmicutes bacterium]|nr:hypothetical protein [Bacillota bacterium]
QTRRIWRKNHVVATLDVRGGRQKTVPIVTTQAVWITAPTNAQVKRYQALPRQLQAPVLLKPVGRVTFLVPGQAPVTVLLKPARSVRKKAPPARWFIR